jgi:hypothetical protein
LTAEEARRREELRRIEAAVSIPLPYHVLIQHLSTFPASRKSLRGSTNAGPNARSNNSFEKRKRLVWLVWPNLLKWQNGFQKMVISNSNKSDGEPESD